MDQFIVLLLKLLPALVIMLGLILCGVSGFAFGAKSEDRKYTAVGGMFLVALGIAGLIWKLLVLLYPLLIFGALLIFAFVGLVRAFKS